jgi:hypothetical protein
MGEAMSGIDIVWIAIAVYIAVDTAIKFNK